MQEIALFPIPGMVSLPYSTVPLHVFEPRYRELIKDSVRLKRPIAVCHTKKVIHAANPHQRLEEVLHTNQSTYEPVDVFSAGLSRILEVTADGRMIVEVQMQSRYQRGEDVQILPYRISKCEPYNDQHFDNDLQVQTLRQQIDAHLIHLSERSSEMLARIVDSQAWRALSDEEYSFKVFQAVKMEPEMMQMLLELRSVQQRLVFLARILANGPVQ